MTRYLRESGSRLRTRRSVHRQAFTLVEILVVVAVIGILMSIIAVASVRAIAGARANATRTTIKKIDEALSRKMTAFERSMTCRNLAGRTVEAETVKKYLRFLKARDLSNPGALKDPCTPTPLDQLRLTQKFFGTEFGEISKWADGTPLAWTVADLGPAELNAMASATPPKYNPMVATAADPDRSTESAELLYWFLVHGPTFGADAVEADSFSSSEVADTDGDGLLEFVDAWGNPLRFYRWPTRILRPGPPTAPGTAASGGYYPLGAAYPGGATTPTVSSQLPDDHPAIFLMASLPSRAVGTGAGDDPSNPMVRPTTPLGHDPLDETGDTLFEYMLEAGYPPVGYTAADVLAATRAFESQYYSLNTWHAPLIVSAGPDGDLGLFEPYDRDNFGHLAQPMEGDSASGFSTALEDNVSNLNSQASGTGGQ